MAGVGKRSRREDRVEWKGVVRRKTLRGREEGRGTQEGGGGGGGVENWEAR